MPGETNFKSRRILVADDKISVAERIRKILLNDGYLNTIAVSTINSFKQFNDFDIILIDIVWPLGLRPYGTNNEYFGLDALSYIRSHHPNTIVVLMSRSVFDLDDLSKIQKADAFLKSNSDASKVLNTVYNCMRYQHLQNSSRLSDYPLVMHSSLMKTKDLKTIILDYLSIAAEALREGSKHPSVLGIEKDKYEKLSIELYKLRHEIESNPDLLKRTSWGERIATLSKLSSGCKNLVDIFNVIIKLCV